MTQPGTIGGWTIVDRLGSGDFATVFRVRATEPDQPDCALKICTHDDVPSQERLAVEVDSLRVLRHPAIPRFEADGTHDGRPFCVMSLGPGKTLKSIIEERDAVGLVHGDIEAMRIVVGLLDAISHIHERGLVHRDIKDANVLSDPAYGVTLIDYGFCKAAGTQAIRSTDSYWRVGSARFSPPAKLENPALAEPLHDVYAVGVLAYRLLTGNFPWSAPEHEGAQALRTIMQREPLLPVREHNSRVTRMVSDFVARLLAQDDNHRPTAADALTTAREFLAKADEVGGHLPRRPSRISFEHVIRDPLYGDIRLTDQEYRTLDTKEMQRLRSIKQLGLTDMVYPGAVHTRLNHSIGCVERVERILTAVERREGIRVEEEIRRVARLYAMTHDVTHIPFGHTIEDELGFFTTHDQNRARIARLTGPGTELGAVLQADDVGQSVLGLLTGALATEWRLAVDLVSSVTGADVLDYVDRDAFFCGIDHRIDSALVRQFRLQSLSGGGPEGRLVSLIGGKYGLRMDREFAVETVLRERYAMFLKVYTHSAKVAGSALLGKALAGVLIGGPGRRPLREEQVEQFGDETLLWNLTTHRPSKEFADQLRVRRFPRGVYRGVMLSENKRTETEYENRLNEFRQKGVLDPRGREALEVALASSAKVEPRNVAIYCPIKAPGYQRVEHWVATSRNAPALVGQGRPDFREQHLGLWDVWVFVLEPPNPASQRAVAEAAQELFGLQNLIEEDRRHGRF